MNATQCKTDMQMDALASKRLARFLKLMQRRCNDSAAAYDEVAFTYDSFAHVWDGHIAAPALQHFNDVMQRHIAPGSKVLDAGAGTGLRTQALLTACQPSSVVTIDASQKMLVVAASKLQDSRVRYRQGDFCCMPFDDNAFDAVICTWALETLDDPLITMQEFVRVIRPNGIVIYAFCSLPEGQTARVAKRVIDLANARQSPISHRLTDSERPFHQCAYASLRHFAWGLTTVATLSKCCPIPSYALLSKLEMRRP